MREPTTPALKISLLSPSRRLFSPFLIWIYFVIKSPPNPSIGCITLFISFSEATKAEEKGEKLLVSNKPPSDFLSAHKHHPILFTIVTRQGAWHLWIICLLIQRTPLFPFWNMYLYKTLTTNTKRIIMLVIYFKCLCANSNIIIAVHACARSSSPHSGPEYQAFIKIPSAKPIIAKHFVVKLTATSRY